MSTVSTLTHSPTTSPGPGGTGDDDGPVVAATDLYRSYHAGDEGVLALRGVSLRARTSRTAAP